jgi:hypothetical protein
MTLTSSQVSAFSQSSGEAGEVSVDAGHSLALRDDSSISTATSGSGSGGRIAINPSLATQPDGRDVSLSDSEIRTSASDTSTGDAGDIDVRAGGELSLARSRISALSEGSGVAGRVDVDAGQRLTLSDQSSITTQASASTGGKLTVAARELVYVVDSEITTQVLEGPGGGGSITIDPTFVVLDGASIVTDAGSAGDILIEGDHLFLSSDTEISASSREDIDGEIVAEPPETEVIGQLTALETSLVDASSLLTTPCAARTAPAGSFVVSSRTPLAASPDAPLSWIGVAGLSALSPAGPECPAQATP